VNDAHRFVIADRWSSGESYEAFKREFAADFTALSERGERLHRAEHLIGRFEFVE
jgi:hypothetical protein